MNAPNKIIIELPVPSEMQAIPSVFTDTESLREVMVFGLYGKGLISKKLAREFLGLSRRDFEDKLPEFGQCVVPTTLFSEDVETLAKW